MTDSAVPDSSARPLQFDAVQSVEGNTPEAQAPVCVQCEKPIAERYFEVHGHVVCGPCKDALSEKLGIGRVSRLGRAALYGTGAAIVGAVLYYAVSEATGLEIGIIAIVVGWLVGRAVHTGGGGGGGWKYQALAVGLTYFAIASTYVPLVFKGLAERNKSTASASSATVTPTAAGDSLVVAVAASDSASVTTAKPNKPGFGAILLALGFLVGLPIIANLYDMPSGILGLFILGLGLMQAWRMNKPSPLTFTGPFQVRSGTPSGSPVP